MQIAEMVLFLPSVLLFSILASYTDIKSRKIRNSLILRMLQVSLILNVIYYFFGGNFLFHLMFVVVSLVLAVTLWFFDFWKAGDVKFYFALSTFVHPKSSVLFLIPFLGFLTISAIMIFVEGLMKRNIKFKFKFNSGLILPVAAAPFVSLLGINSLVVIFTLLFIGSKIKIAKTSMIYLAIIMFLISPINSIKVLAFSLLFAVLSAFKFKGHLPSAPMISASFIYTLVLASL